MTKAMKTVILIATVMTLAAVITWLATGRDFYTKYQVVEIVEVPIDENDPLAQSGFYDDDEPRTETVERDEFHLGLLPTTTNPFDKHIVSVVSIATPPWGLAALLFVLGWTRRRKSAAA